MKSIVFCLILFLNLPSAFAGNDSIFVRKIGIGIQHADEISAAFAAERVPIQRVSHANWKSFPYKPSVKFRIAHDGQSIFLNFRVQEEEVKAVCLADNTRVSEDSCVEFFVSFGDSPIYYNIESNCIGTIKMAFGTARKDREVISPETLKLIKRASTLPFCEIQHTETKEWELSLLIPKEVFVSTEIESFEGMVACANFYKCGDRLAVPHYLSYFPIQTAMPDFHRSDYFGKLVFE